MPHPALAESLKEKLACQARMVGFSAMRITSPDAIPDAPAHLAHFVDEGRHGQMGWMAERMHWRGAPQALWPEARSVIMLAESYTPKDNPLPRLKETDCGVISVYAQGRDYHDLVKKRLKRLGRWLIAEAGPEVQIKVFVDTAPVMEKPLAQAAGLGWQGKHTNLLSRDLGNWFFLGAIFTTLDLPKDTPEHSHCGTCTACLDICPTKAFPAPYQLDARRCISYLTIEHKGPIDLPLRPLLGNRIYGCDDCLAICPWNKFAAHAHEIGYAERHGTPPLMALAALDEAAFRARFSGSPIKRIGHARFIRNVLYAIGNSKNPALRSAAQAYVSAADPTLADAANWALAQLARESP